MASRPGREDAGLLFEVPTLPACATAREAIGSLRLHLLVHADKPLGGPDPSGDGWFANHTYWTKTGFDGTERDAIVVLLQDGAFEPLDRDEPTRTDAIALTAQFLGKSAIRHAAFGPIVA